MIAKLFSRINAPLGIQRHIRKHFQSMSWFQAYGITQKIEKKVSWAPASDHSEFSIETGTKAVCRPKSFILRDIQVEIFYNVSFTPNNLAALRN